MTIKNKTEINRDIKFNISETIENCDGTIAIGDELITLNGKVAIEKQEGSNKWGDQLQFVLYGNQCKKENRAVGTTGFNRIEIEIPFQLGKELILDFAKRNLGIEGSKKFDAKDWNKDLCENCGEHNFCPKCNKYTWSKK